MAMKQKITPCLWFDMNAEEAVAHYVSIFEDGRIVGGQPCGDSGPGKKGTPLTIVFEIAGQQFIALNGGPHFKFNEAISLSVDCESQGEVDRLWEKLCDGGQPSRCGWLKDKFGVSWQIVPSALVAMLKDADPGRSGRVMAALLKMSKIDIATLQAAYEGA